MEPEEGGKHDEERTPSRPIVNVPAPPQPGCPDAEAWALYEAQLLAPERALELLEHASTCDSCGALLAGLRDDSQPGQEDPVLLLKSGTSVWKQGMLKQIARQGQEENKPSERVRFRPAWVAAAAAIVTMAAGIGWWMNRTRSAPAILAEIAQSYTDQRPFEFRYSGANHAEVRVTRGTAPPARSPEFLEMEARIARQLRDRPSDPVWLRAKARVDLLDGRYEAAIDALLYAKESDANDPEVLGDLAIAYLERSDIEHHVSDAALAVDLLSEALRLNPDNPTYRFNLALAKERLPAPHEAADEWREFLRREPSGGWADEARRHLQTLGQVIERQQAFTDPNGEDLQEGTVVAALQRHSWADVEALSAATMARHGDTWVRDLLAASRHDSYAPILDLLAAADAANARGEPDTARRYAENARSKLAIHDSAGLALAAWEWAYALQRLSRPEQCVEKSREELPVTKREHYRHLEVKLDLALASCLSIEGQFDQAIQLAGNAKTLAASANYSVAAMWSDGIHAAFLTDLGAYRDAIRIDHDGLDAYWAGHFSVVRSYQFYYDMATGMRALGHVHTVSALMREAVTAAALQSNRPVEGMARSVYGEDLFLSGKPHEAEEEFVKAGSLLTSLPDAPARQLYGAYPVLGRARIAARNNRPQEGMESLRDLNTLMAGVKNPVLELRISRVRADLLLQSGDPKAAERSLRETLDRYAGEEGSPARASDRLTMTTEASSALAALVDLEIRQGEELEAFRTRETYLPSYRSFPSIPRTAVRLTFVDLLQGPIVWISTADETHFVRLRASSAELRLLKSNLRRALSDPHSSLERVRSLGQALYQKLMADLPPIRDVHQLLISADSAFQEIPFSVLVGPDGQWLAERYEISYSLPLRPSAAPPRPSALGREVHFLGVSAGEAVQLFEHSLPDLPHASSEVAQAAGGFPSHSLLTGAAGSEKSLENHLPSAGIFHFSGHAIVFSGDAALVLPERRGESEADLLWGYRLKPELLRSCRLAVLSACSTARMADDSDPSSLLARAFLQNGVPQVIAARWDVDSATTAALMRTFYEGVDQGVSVERALQAASARVRSASTTTHPYYWAAFDVFRR